MNKKPGLVLIVSVFAMIILASAFNMDFGGNPPVKLPNGINPDSVLYVCPAADSVWNQFSSVLHFLGKYAYLFFFFVFIVLGFSWGWALYQNLLKDKFSADAYKNPWDLTKVFFWMTIIFVVLYHGPNYFRSVTVRGHGSDWVLCESTSAGAKAILPKNVSLGKK